MAMDRFDHSPRPHLFYRLFGGRAGDLEQLLELCIGLAEKKDTGHVSAIMVIDRADIDKNDLVIFETVQPKSGDGDRRCLAQMR